jgi:hypothetical protein
MTKKRPDSFRLSLHPRIFSACRVILLVVSRNNGRLALQLSPDSAVRFSFPAASAGRNRTL